MMRKICVVCILFVCVVINGFSQGSLTPPGAPGATMKSLDQVEPRTPISEAGTTISESGSYYLADNLNLSGSQAGITISSSDVTLDLNGFTVDGSNGSSSGIVIGSGYENIRVENGTVRDCLLVGISANNAENCSFVNLRLVGNDRLAAGVPALFVGEGSVAEACRVESNTGLGLYAKGGSRIVGNRIVGNGGIGLTLSGTGSYVADNIVKENDGNYSFANGNQLNLLLCEIPETLAWSCSAKLAGSLTSTTNGVVITASDVTLDLAGFTLSGDGGSGDSGVFLDGATNDVLKNVWVRNGVVKNFGNGVLAEYCDGCRVEQLMVADNYYCGVEFQSEDGQCDGNMVSDCSISGNGDHGVIISGRYGQCDGNTVAGCTIRGNGSCGVSLDGAWGQCDGNTVVDCTISGNESYGVSLFGAYDGDVGLCDGNMIAGCTIRENGDRGISLQLADGNRIDRNHITGQSGSGATYGIYCSSTADNLIFHNTCVGQGYNFELDSDDVYGPIVTASGELSTSGAAAHPLANFSY